MSRMLYCQSMNSKTEVRRAPEQDRSRTTLQSIMDASAILIGKHGLDAISMTQIATQSGMSKASLYRYFPSKQALLIAHAEQSFARNREEMRRIMQKVKDPEEMLREGFSHYCKQHANSPFLLHLRAAIHADPVLSKLDLKDSRENAALLVEFLNHHFPGLEPEFVKTRSLLAMELADSLARLGARVSAGERKKLIDEFVNVFFSDLKNLAQRG